MVGFLKTDRWIDDHPPGREMQGEKVGLAALVTATKTPKEIIE